MIRHIIIMSLAIVFLSTNFARAEIKKGFKVTSKWPVFTNGDFDYFANFQRLASMNLQLYSSGGQPEVICLEPSKTHRHIWLLKYFSGCAGTSTIWWIYRAIIIDISRSKVLGDVSYYEQIGPINPNEPIPCNWIWKKDRIIIPMEDEEPRQIILPAPESAIKH